MVRSQKYFLLLIYHTLIEIRASDPTLSESSAKLADILHNVPISMCNEWSEERARALLGKIAAKAGEHGMSSDLARLDSSVKANLARMDRPAGSDSHSEHS